MKALEEAVEHATRSVSTTGSPATTRCSKPQQQLFPAQNTLAQIRRDRLLAYVQLYKALGGGWTLTDAQWSDQEKQSGS